MTQLDSEKIKQSVRERYSAMAREASGDADRCCASSCCQQADDETVVGLYSSAETEAIPVEAVAASAGCGNPAALASLKSGETVVDFGSGGGIDCFLAARVVGPSGRVIGVDMTPDMVSLARSNAAKLGLSNVEFYLSEMEHTPVPSGSADALISNCVINLAPDKDAVFREAFRVLKPGGRLMVSDLVKTEERPADASRDMSDWAGCLAGTELLSTYVARMEKAGFRDVAVIAEAPWKGRNDRQAGLRSVSVEAWKPR